MTSTAPRESSPDWSPSPCFFWGFVRVGNPRMPLDVSHYYLSNDSAEPTNNVATTKIDVLLLKTGGFRVEIVSLCQNLEASTLRCVNFVPCPAKWVY